MNVMDILKANGAALLREDLDFFETELGTGEYAEAYVEECLKLISQIRGWQKAPQEKTNQPALPGSLPASVFVDPASLSPLATQPVPAAWSAAEQVAHDLEGLRQQPDYKAAFKDYISKSALIDEAFLDAHFTLFQPWETGAIVSAKPLSEAFLEKYFAELDAEKIARYQTFSEAFFIKHFAKLDPSLVLEKGKNEWRRKENRSTQLDVFLRLKGVRI